MRGSVCHFLGQTAAPISRSSVRSILLLSLALGRQRGNGLPQWLDGVPRERFLRDQCARCLVQERGTLFYSCPFSSRGGAATRREGDNPMQAVREGVSPDVEGQASGPCGSLLRTPDSIESRGAPVVSSATIAPLRYVSTPIVAEPARQPSSFGQRAPSKDPISPTGGIGEHHFRDVPVPAIEDDVSSVG
jgi:hypothetical protein